MTIMDHTETIKAMLTDLIRPIILEAIQEAFDNMEKVKGQTKRYYTVQEVCKILRIGVTSFYRMVNKGDIELLKIRGKSLVDADKLDGQVQRKEIFRYKRK